MKFSQAPSSIVMVRPAAFALNLETAQTNAFQNTENKIAEASTLAQAEFDRMVDKLSAHDIEVIVIQDTPEPRKPDAVFPNNWISFHEDGTVVLYPMLADNRRLERLLPIVDTLRPIFAIKQILDYSRYESGNEFLEGTGSIVFDYPNRIAYACRSARTNEGILKEVCRVLGFKPVVFDAVDERGVPVYHTNVLMCVGSRFAVVCLDAIRDEQDQEILLASFSSTNHKVVAISYAQMAAFAGNMIEVKTKTGEPVVLLSETAFNSLLPGQINAITKYADMLPLSIPTIEQLGGGSVRCMVAGVFNPKL